MYIQARRQKGVIFEAPRECRRTLYAVAVRSMWQNLAAFLCDSHDVQTPLIDIWYCSATLQGVLPKEWNHVWNWKEYYDDCCKFAKTLIHLDVAAFKITNILGFNSVIGIFILLVWFIIFIESPASDVMYWNRTYMEEIFLYVNTIPSSFFLVCLNIFCTLIAWVDDCQQWLPFCKLYRRWHLCNKFSWSLSLYFRTLEKWSGCSRWTQAIREICKHEENCFSLSKSACCVCWGCPRRGKLITVDDDYSRCFTIFRTSILPQHSSHFTAL